jgi:bifunctional UDP-N-acetylglucosamine pyrophosphorylase/glucosamine-1-phosphate N-acetyltransferase
MIREINAGLYAYDAALLVEALGKLTTHNDQREEYLTDVVGLFVDSGRAVGAFEAADATEVRGCNDRVELAALCALLRDRTNTALMLAGVSIADPATTWIDVTATVGRDAVIEPHTQLRGATRVAEGAVVGPDSTLIDTFVGEGARVVRSHAVGARLGPRAQVGPFAYLRPGTVVGDEAKVGAFVEVKNSEIGAGAKVPHLSYVGDATVGPAVNIGAGTIVVNYDGVGKHHTTIGEAAFIGCDTSLIAPVEIGAGAYVAAGSVINRSVPPGALGVTRSPQREIGGWVPRRRAGTKSAQAAQAAQATAAAAQGGAAADRRAEGAGGAGADGSAVPSATGAAQLATPPAGEGADRTGGDPAAGA